MKINPKCKAGKDYSYSAKGFLLPCCWCDELKSKSFENLGFKDDKLKLENNESVDDGDNKTFILHVTFCLINTLTK